MEIESSTKKRAKATGESSSEDRLSGLPDDVLHSILGGLSLKSAVRTGALSTRWARLWIHAIAASAVLDFTDRDFVRGQSPAQIAATVARCIAIHGAAPIDVFRVALSPVGALGQDVLEWIAAALGRGAREVRVDLARPGILHNDDASLLQLPDDLFQVENSLAVLSLGRCSLRAVRPGAAGLAGLTSLSLDRVDVTDDALRDVVSGCRLLEFLSLRSCHLLRSVRVNGERLRGLEIVCCLAMRDLHVAAPALESFALHGDILYSRDDYLTEPIVFVGKGNSRSTWNADTPELRDAYLSHLGFGEYDPVIHDFAYSCALLKVAHARILTLCSKGLLHIDVERNCLELDVDTPNLEELQLLMGSMGDDDLALFAGFFELTVPPLLERLFVQLPAACNGTTTGEDEDIVLDEEIVLDHLTFVKMMNFRGTTHELMLLRFVLRRAPVLEQLVLVTPEEEGTPTNHGKLLKIVQEHVSQIRKASPDAHITVCRPQEDDSRSPAHTKYYHDDQENSS
ncbi:F-box protein At3g62230-like [Lolium perenne]|uniref:F-box protein At3g62230-like n=1 Tax=Lolium perenne TaxID=4522 RepID=UPI0021EA51A4|nr:FBD-associated F-box protein At4g10400-like [Lolium perenne]